jgi:outer membrane protein TolC
MQQFIPLVAALTLAATAGAGTLRLDAAGAVRLALANNRQVALAQEKLVEANAGRGAQFGAFLPQVTASGSYTRLGTVNEFTMYSLKYGSFPLRVYDPVTGDIIGFTDSVAMPVGLDTLSLSLGSADNFVLRGTVQQTLFTWGKLWNAYRIAGLTAELQRAALAAAREQVRVDALAGFWGALLAHRSAAVMAESRDQLERHVNRVRALYDNGLATSLDVARATLGLSNLSAQAAQVQSAAGLADAALGMTLGLGPDVELELADDFRDEPLSLALDAATGQALANRPELVQLRAALGMADRGVAIARTANLPTAFAQLNYDYKNPVGFSAGWGDDWNVTAGLSMPLFTGGANYHKLRAAESRRRQARISLAQVEDAVRLEVQSLFVALERERQNIEYAAASRAVAETALSLADTRYQNGLLTNLEYLDAQLALTQSRLAYESALANHEIARAKLLRAVGASEAGK